ncbi:alpha-amylase family glycosyl hydrolase [Brevundimonas balnearis]|uniref:Alpha-amylase family glycosyl hydrolase n=1 Tax=Brevundimonas balnearis TaxID=1572858 RepID=A0ABV6R8E7_9CAUL
MSLSRARRVRFASAAATAALALVATAPVAAQEASFRERLPEDEVVYFVLPDRFENGDPANDRGGLTGDRLVTGFDPTHKGFYQGGDLAGLIRRLDYIQGLGATAIWLGPIYKNKPVQGAPGAESAGYHGYWITDFTQVDPHFGTNAEMQAFVDAAHARGMKVYLDVITNHTADVIRYRECYQAPCEYRSRADYPYQTRGGIDGAPINPGFMGDGPEHQTAENFARLTDPNFAYTPFVPEAEAEVKVPAWLNDPILYHNRGDSDWRGPETVTMGDFAGLDDLMTENPRVVQGFIDIFGGWIDRFGIDGFRIDTAKHVNPEFWQAFVPAMQERARARGVENFQIFGEVYEFQPGALARFTRVDRYPSVLDFAFQGAAVEVFGKGAGTDVLERLYFQDPVYAGGAEAARRLQTFLGNHDMGRFARFVREAQPDASPEEIQRRVELAHVLLMTGRGSPVIYYGDEQGFAGDGGDQDARETMFPSRVASYNDNTLVGSDATPAEENFDTGAPLYRLIAELAAVRRSEPALARGDQVVRASSAEAGVFAFSRRLDGVETLVVLNTAETPFEGAIEVDVGSESWRSLAGACAPAAQARGSVHVRLGPLDYIICTTRDAA